MSPAASPTTSRRSSIKVRLEVIASSSDAGDVLAALGLGSCIGLVLADPGRMATMANVMLPDPGAISSLGTPGKYADTTVPDLLEDVERLGGRPDELVAKMTGGAQMFSDGTGGGQLDIGVRNAVAVRAALQAAGIKLRAADTGRTLGRTLELEVGLELSRRPDSG